MRGSALISLAAGLTLSSAATEPALNTVAAASGACEGNGCRPKRLSTLPPGRAVEGESGLECWL